MSTELCIEWTWTDPFVMIILCSHYVHDMIIPGYNMILCGLMDLYISTSKWTYICYIIDTAHYKFSLEKTLQVPLRVW